MNVTAAIYARLAADTTLISRIATYGVAPAIFTSRPVPSNATLPYVVAAADMAATPFDTLDKRGRDIRRDVFCFARNTGSAAAIEAIADALYNALDNAPLTVSGAHVVRCNVVAGPAEAPTDDSLTGRVITIRIVARKV